MAVGWVQNTLTSYLNSHNADDSGARHPAANIQLAGGLGELQGRRGAGVGGTFPVGGNTGPDGAKCYLPGTAKPYLCAWWGHGMQKDFGMGCLLRNSVGNGSEASTITLGFLSIVCPIRNCKERVYF